MRSAESEQIHAARRLLEHHAAGTTDSAQDVMEVPVSKYYDAERFDIEMERITLRGETENSSQIDTIATALKGHRCFKEVKEGKVEKSRDGQKTLFSLDIQVQCPEQPQTEEG